MDKKKDINYIYKKNKRIYKRKKYNGKKQRYK